MLECNESLGEDEFDIGFVDLTECIEDAKLLLVASCKLDDFRLKEMAVEGFCHHVDVDEVASLQVVGKRCLDREFEIRQNILLADTQQVNEVVRVQFSFPEVKEIEHGLKQGRRVVLHIVSYQ